MDLSVLAPPSKRAALYVMFVTVAMEAAVKLTAPTYIQIVQGRTPPDTAIAMMAVNLAVFVTATHIVRFHERYAPRANALLIPAEHPDAFRLAFVVTDSGDQ